MSGHLRFGIGEEFTVVCYFYVFVFLLRTFINFYLPPFCTLLFLLTARSIAEDRGVVLGRVGY